MRVVGCLLVSSTLATIVACGGSVVPVDGADGADATTIDVAPGIDGATTDVPAMDGALDASAGDVIPMPDGTSPDASPSDLTGTWRIVRYVTSDGDGGTLTITDTDTPTMSGGITVDLRGNGLLFLSPGRVAQTYALLLNDHTTVNDATMYSMAQSAFGFAAPGTWSGLTFNVVGGGSALAFTVLPDGSITYTDPGSGARMTFVRMTAPLGASTYSGNGQASIWQQHGTPTPLTHPRVVLAWDRAGAGAGYTYFNDRPLAFDVLDNAAYAVATLTTPPPEALGSIAGTPAAFAYSLVYDDTNANAAYDDGVDVLRGVSEFAIGWRGTTATSGFAASRFRDLDVGFQMVHLQVDYGFARLSAEPLDPTQPVPPDTLVDVAATGATLPDLL